MKLNYSKNYINLMYKIHTSYLVQYILLASVINDKSLNAVYLKIYQVVC